jgi:cytochrome c-type biogenesis protein CcmH
MSDLTRVPLSRRRFLAALSAGAGAVVAARAALAQDQPQVVGTSSDSTTAQSAASNVVMDESVVRPVRLPPKPNARPLLDNEQRDALEHRIKCQCGCTLDVYTCRTTDFSCSVSPAMHRDVQRLVEGGQSADEIIAAFVDTYGERVLMEPKREGFNWAGYIAPFAALGAGAVVVGSLIKRWGARAAAASPARTTADDLDLDATPEELARLDAAVRREEA